MSDVSNHPVTTHGIHLHPVGDYFGQLHEEGKKEEEANVGSVWTIQLNGTATVKVMGLATCDYTLNLNCSHVGPSMFGVYRGEISLDFKGDITGTKLILGALGLRTSEDLAGWFKNDNFVMKIKPYNKEDEDGFFETFDRTEDDLELNRPKLTGDASKDAITQATYDGINNLFNSLLSNASTTNKSDESLKTTNKKPMGLWYDWSFHMTEGDMGMFMKINGGLPWYNVNAKADVDSKYSKTEGQAVVRTPFTPTMHERYDEFIDTPFPYTIKLFPDGTVMFTLYNQKGGPITVSWVGKIHSIPVSETTVVK